MFKFEYDIKINDAGRPYIDVSPENENIPEHKFMVYELARYFIYDILKRNDTVKTLTDETKQMLMETTVIFKTISDEMARLLIGQKNALDEIKKQLNPNGKDNIENKDKEE